MTMYNSSDIGFLFVRTRDVAPTSDKFEVSASNPAADTTPFGVSAAKFEQPGVKRFEITGHDGWYDSGSMATVFGADWLDTNVLMFGYQGNAKGKGCICAPDVKKAGWNRKFAVGEFTRAAFEIVVNGKVEDALIVKAYGAIAGDGNSEADYLDLGAAGFPAAAGCTVYTVASAIVLDGRADFIMTLEDSADHIVWADQTVMTAITIPGAAEAKASTDLTVNRYVAAKWAFTGAGGSPTASFVMAVKVN